MGRPCISNQFCVAFYLFSIYYSGICTDQALDTRIGVGQKQSQNSTYARKEGSDYYYETSSSNIEAFSSVETVQKHEYISSTVLAIIEPSSISHESSGRIGSTFNAQSLAESDLLSSFSLSAWSQSRATPAHFNSRSTSDDYSAQETQSAQPTSASLSVIPLSMSSVHSLIPSLATSYDLPSYNSEGYTSLVDATSTTPKESMTPLISSLSRRIEPSQIVSSSQLMLTSSITVSTADPFSTSNSTTSLRKKTSSLHSTAISYISSVTSMLRVSYNASSQLALVTSSLETSSMEALSVSSVTPSSSWHLVTSPSFSVVSNQSNIRPIAKTGCNVVLDGLASAMGQMTFCLIKHLRPIEVCAECTKFHSKLRRYENLIHNTKDCEKELILDYNAQYQAVRKMYKVQYDMWQDFECESKFVS